MIADAYNTATILSAEVRECVANNEGGNGEQYYIDLLQALETLARADSYPERMKAGLLEMCDNIDAINSNSVEFCRYLKKNETIKASISLKLIAGLQTYADEIRDKVTDIPQPQTSQQPFVIDERLNTDKAKAMFEKFATEEYIEIVEGGHYKWLKTKMALSYFVFKAIDYLKMKKNTKKNTKTWKCFEELFEIKKLQSYHQNHEFDYESNSDCRKIKVLFEKNFF